MESSIKLRALKQWINRNGPGAAVPAGQMETVYTTPHSEVRLDRFVSMLRKDYRDGTLDHDVKRALDDIGFQWEISRGPRSTAEQRRRNAQILALRASGKSLAQIADRFDLSRQRIHQVIKASK